MLVNMYRTLLGFGLVCTIWIELVAPNNKSNYFGVDHVVVPDKTIISDMILVVAILAQALLWQ